MVAGAVNYLEDVCTPAGGAIVDEVCARWKTFHAASDVVCLAARIRMLSEQPETIGHLVYNSVCDRKTGVLGPIQKDLIEISLRIF